MSIVLLGGGGHASDILCVIEALVERGDGLEPVYVADDSWQKPERFEDRGHVKMVESIEAGARLAPFIVSIGYPQARYLVNDLAVAAGGIAAAPIAHPKASIGSGAELGDGALVMGQAWLSAMVQVGNHSHVSYGATIGHDTRIGEFCSVMPGACICGDVTIGDGVLIGANATVLEGVSIAAGARIGAGAMVNKDVSAGETVVGVPAKKSGG